MFDYKKYVDGLLGVADDLVTAPTPNCADKCSAVGRLYYALFSELCGSNAEAFIGSGLRKAWGEVYRGLNHGEARKACNHLKNMKEFPQKIEDFAHLFGQLQGRRHLADYDPTVDFYVWKCKIGFVKLDASSPNSVKCHLKTGALLLLGF